ncbi:MAG: MoxR family ATPase [Phycisphaeraceae bacterium]|nr:MoxR family ATPase [Phycisphaeraceae bacterium]
MHTSPPNVNGTGSRAGLDAAAGLVERLRANIARVFLGNPRAVDRLLCCLLARGHVLIEDVPGVGKTLLAHALARSINCGFSRIQLTPDMLPADIVGTTVLSRQTQAFEFVRGPLFANIVLADEINRTPPRTQTALLEAMNEGSVTVDGRTHRLEPPFMVVATQNPSGFDGTYPLPENQLDRFLMRLSLGYPTADEEARVLDLRPADHALAGLLPIMDSQSVLALQVEVDHARLDRSLADYIVSLAAETRRSPELSLGMSPRGSLALAQAARATAVLHGRDYVIPDDIVDNIIPVCSHRVIARDTISGSTDDGQVSAVLREITDALPVPG